MNIKLKINTAIFIIMCVIAVLFLIGKSGCNILSGIRAYVGAEGLWAKAQKEATYQLVQYIFTEDATRYHSFIENLKIPLGDRQARVELEKSNGSDSIATEGFIDGGNHPNDIPTMISLYKRFKDTEKIGDAIDQWKRGDMLIQELLKVGEESHAQIVNNGMAAENKIGTIAEIDSLQRQLNEAEILFSRHMTEAAREAASIFFLIMLTCSIIGSIVCLIMLRMISSIIAESNVKNQQLAIQTKKEMLLRTELTENEKKFRALADTSPLAIYMSTGLEQQAVYINPTFTKLFGYTFDEVPTVDDWWPLAYPTDVYRKIIKDEWQSRVKEALATRSAIKPMETMVTCKDGTVKHISWGYITIGTENWACGLDLTERKRAEEEQERLIAELRKALSEIKTLRGILPICSYCKNIRNEEGYFEQIESYIHQHSDVDFSHTICTSCMQKHHPKEYEYILKNDKL